MGEVPSVNLTVLWPPRLPGEPRDWSKIRVVDEMGVAVTCEITVVLTLEKFKRWLPYRPTQFHRDLAMGPLGPVAMGICRWHDEWQREWERLWCSLPQPPLAGVVRLDTTCV